jgi:hypothetical protein
MSDAVAHTAGLLSVEVGDLGIKGNRRARAVPVSPGGVVADYVPFYFAPRSPMMFSISRGNVASYQGGTARLIYLTSTLERLDEAGCQPLLTDRNAALRYAEYRLFDPSDPIDDDFIDWDLMGQRDWYNTPDEPQRKERRMAEALVHDRVPWEAMNGIATQSEIVAAEVREILSVALVNVPVNVRPSWYF